MDIPKFETKSELFDWLLENKSMLIKQKKEADYKRADGFSPVYPQESSFKAAPIDVSDKDSIEVTAVINTTGVMDSHDDVHINGLWKKSLKENKDILFLQEHKMDFEHLISDEVKATAEMVSWKDLGFNFKGETQALTFRSKINKDVNEFMFEKYAKGVVKQHSVGMRYVKLELAINSDDEDFKAEKKAWDKFIDQVVNRKRAEERGFFFAVTEAKVIEGSAVLRGSNTFTPTRSVEAKEDIEAVATDTSKTGAAEGTPNEKSKFWY